MDDFIRSLIPQQEDGDAVLFQQTNPTIPLQQDLFNPGTSLPPVERSDLTMNDKRGKQGKSTPPEDDKKTKKVVHRDIERQRRQEMTNLYASLRTLLPLEYVKGKRSTSDLVNEAVNYIKHLEEDIQQLELKKNKLRSLSPSRDLETKRRNSRNPSPFELTVKSCSEGGLEVLISNDVKEEWIPLSGVLEVLLQEGFTVVSCVCTKVKENFLYTIQSEASHSSGVDLCVLKQKLTHKINTRIAGDT